MINDLKYCQVFENTTIKKCFLFLEKSTKQIIFVIDKKKNLLGSITDGDLRRAILKNSRLDQKINNIYNKKPIVSSKKISEEDAKKIMIINKINHLPIINNKKKLMGFYSLNSYEEIKEKKCDFIIMAGGRGKRLSPLTNRCPKPMLKISGKPILEIILNNAKKFGFKNFYISINYLGYKIQKYFKNGKKFNLNINYIKERKPQGTIGCLGNIKKKLQESVIVINGDIVSNVNYRTILEFHNNNRADATMGVYPFKLENPYGEVKTLEGKIIDIYEKPITISHVNAGVYVFSKKVFKFLKENQYMDTVNFFKILKQKKYKTLAFPIHEFWADIGLKKDYLKLNNNE